MDLEKNYSYVASRFEYYDKIVQSIENGTNIDSIYLDFEKMFDKVDNGLLCHLLKEKRIWGKTQIWIACF